MWKTVLMSAFAGFGGILYGYDTNVIAGIAANPDYIITFGRFDALGGGFYLPIEDSNLIMFILFAGGFLGAVIAQPLGDRLGRKYGIIAGCLVFILGVGLQLATNLVAFVTGRVIAGVGISIISCLAPMYQSESAPKDIRGFIVGLYQVSYTIGSLLSAILLKATEDLTNHSSWRTPISVEFAWAFILGGGMLLLPESPRYLLFKGRDADARQALGRLLGKSANSQEVHDECRAVVLALHEASTSTYFDCFVNNKNRYGLRTWTVIFLPAWLQLTGVGFIIFYGGTFFLSAGIESAYLVSIIFNVISTAVTICSLPLIDKIGRRRLLIIGAAGMCVCEFTVAIVSVTVGKVYIDANGVTVNLIAQRILVAFVCIYYAFFTMSWGPVPRVVVAEIFPLSIRQKGMSISVASTWLWNFCFSYGTPYLVEPTTHSAIDGTMIGANLGTKVFFIWGGTCLGSLLFAYFFIPDTHGLSLEQIDIMYRDSSMVGSVKYRQTILDRTAREKALGVATAYVMQPMEVPHSDDGKEDMTAAI